MKNVFYNVLWGSFTGGMAYMSLTILDDSRDASEKYSFKFLTTQFIYGATVGGLIGLGVGTYLSMSGVTFDENLSRIAHYTPVPGLEDERPNLRRAGRLPLIQYNLKF